MVDVDVVTFMSTTTRLSRLPSLNLGKSAIVQVVDINKTVKFDRSCNHGHTAPPHDALSWRYICGG